MYTKIYITYILLYIKPLEKKKQDNDKAEHVRRFKHIYS